MNTQELIELATLCYAKNEGEYGDHLLFHIDELQKFAAAIEKRMIVNAVPTAYKWAGVLIPAEEAHQYHRDEGVALYALERLDTARCSCCGYLVTETEHRGCLAKRVAE